jgi:hypothetical protein
MVIAILYALGVGAAGILLLLIGLMLFKRYKTIKHPAVFKTRVRLTQGQFPGLKDTWKKCYGAWVTTVFSTRKGLPLNIADVLPVANLDQLRNAAPADEVKGLGETPIIGSFTMTTGAKLDVAMSAKERHAGLKPWQVRAEQLALDAMAPVAPAATATSPVAPATR